MSDLKEKAEAIKARRPRKVKEEWVPPTLADLASGRILAFDQTINKTGFAMFGVKDGTFVEWEHGTLRVEADPLWTGHLDTLYRARMMSKEIRQVVNTWARLGPVVVHELPAVHGYRTESSLLAAHAIQMACEEEGLRYIAVANQHMKKVMIDNSGVSKAEVKKAVLALTGASGSWNQDNADALALGCTYLYDFARASARG